MTRWRTMLASAVAGAALAYFLDPDRGRARRARFRDQAAALFRRGGRRLGRTGRLAGSEAYGLWQRAAHRTPEEPYPDDLTLAHKVESELFGDADIPKGSININVEDGIVVFRGQVERPDQANRLEEGAGRIPGVRGVRNLLHLPGTAAPNKAEARRAGAAGGS
jgi:hypothetical protein